MELRSKKIATTSFENLRGSWNSLDSPALSPILNESIVDSLSILVLSFAFILRAQTQTQSHSRWHANPNHPHPFDSLPEELLLTIFKNFDPIKRCSLLSICRKWNQNMNLNQSLWTSLTLPPHHNFTSSLSILRSFNSKSGYQMKHVLISSIIETDQELRDLFQELQKSNTLKVLALVQLSKMNTETRILTRKLLPNLNTIMFLDSEDHDVMEGSDFLGKTDDSSRSQTRKKV